MLLPKTPVSHTLIPKLFEKLALALICLPAMTQGLFAEEEAKMHIPHHYSSKHTRHEITPHLHKACQIFLTSELLYWTTKEEGLDYGMSFYEAGGTSNLSTVYGTIRNINPEFHLG